MTFALHAERVPSLKFRIFYYKSGSYKEHELTSQLNPEVLSQGTGHGRSILAIYVIVYTTIALVYIIHACIYIAKT